MSAGAEFTCDLRSEVAPLPHFWEHTVGSGHATLALRADWQSQLARCHRELGFRHVRFHGILSDDVGTLVRQNDALVYSFFNADQIWDFLLSIGMRPFVELSFMPEALASGRKTVFHYRANVTPPKDDGEWETLVRNLASHCAERYGRDEVSRWFFEIWNEPNLKAFWTGTRTDYFRLYRHAARALKEVDPSIAVGGPATAKNAWIAEFLAFCETECVPADFVTTHHYPTDAFGKATDDTTTQLAMSRRSVLRDQARDVFCRARGKPVYYTEWSSSSNSFYHLHDEPYAAAFLVKTILEAVGLVQGYSWWTFSDVFEEIYFSSVPFHGGFGLLTIHGVPKPAYRAFELLHRLGDESLPVSGRHPTVDAWVVRNGRQVTALLTNWAQPRHPIGSERATIRLLGANGVGKARIERIDGEHANARRAWIEMGSPGSLSPSQVESLEAASRLSAEPLSLTRDEEGLSLEVVLPPQAVAAVSIEAP